MKSDPLYSLRPAANAPKCVFLNTYYPGFLASHYLMHPGLERDPYRVQKESLQAAFFGDSDFYSRGLGAAGWRAEDLIVNCEPLQRAWARENGSEATGLPLVLEQIRALAPDVAYLQDLNLAGKEFLGALRPLVSLIAGQIASPVPEGAWLRGFDLLVSSFPHFVDVFRKLGVAAYYQPLAFDERVWQKVSDAPRNLSVTFVGGISPSHGGGNAFLEALASGVAMDFWGYGADSLAPDSAIRKSHHGEVWGTDMFRLLASSRITVNRHIDTAANNANNMRLFEATGSGALLITDYKDNLHELFEIGREIAVYRSVEECAALIQYYRDNPLEAESVARAGQARTLRDHTYLKRMESTSEILSRHLRYRRDGDSMAPPDHARINYGKSPISEREITATLTGAWKDDAIPARQRALTQSELRKMYSGATVTPYQALADCLAPLARPGAGLLEIGCSTGYYYEVLEYLLKKRLSYTGVDYSDAMIEMAADYYPRADFRVADGAKLPFDSGSFPVVVSSCVLLHVPNYAEHIRETARVSGEYVVAHRTPVCRNRPTHHLKKFGYGVEMVELVFNEAEILGLFAENGLELIRTLEVGKEDGDDLFCMNYVFRKRPGTRVSPVRHYCTLFDRNYLTRGVALAHSLRDREKRDYVLHAVCLDEISRLVMEKLAIPGVDPVGLHEIEAGDASLLAARADRSVVEYYWTLTPCIIQWFLEKVPDAGAMTYLDSDLFFFSSPDPVFSEFERGSVLIHGHRFSPSMKFLEPENGIYNVGLLSFRQDAKAARVLQWWRERCIEWCKAKPEDGKMGDQKYLDDWPSRFEGVKVLEHVGAGLAPWNADQYRISRGEPQGDVRVDGLPVVFFHFHALAMPSRDVIIPAKHPHYPLTPELVALLYLPYASALLQAIDEAVSVMPGFRFGYGDAAALQAGQTFLARPGIRIAGAESMPTAEVGNGWLCYLSAQMRAQSVSEAVKPAIKPHFGTGNGQERNPDTAPGAEAAREGVPDRDWIAAVEGAEMLFVQGRKRESKAALLALKKKTPDDSRLLNGLAVVSHSEGDLNGALGYLVEALKKNSRDRLTLMNLIDLGMEGSLFKPIQDLILGYLDGKPDDWEVRTPLIRAEEAEMDRVLARSYRSDKGYRKKPYLVTALVSTYKSAAFMEECLTDLEAQTLSDKLEIIIVDADSPEEERSVVERFQCRYDNIRYIRTRERIGIYPAWNLAIRAASGTYLTPFSTNDRLAPNAYEVLYKALLEHPEAGLSYGDSHLTALPHQAFSAFTPTPDYGGAFQWPRYEYEDLLMNCRVGPHPLWRAGLHNEIGYFDGRYKAIGDQDFWLRIALKRPLVHIPVFTGLAWITKESLSGQNSSMQEIFDIHNKHTRAHLERLKCHSSVPVLERR